MAMQMLGLSLTPKWQPQIDHYIVSSVAVVYSRVPGRSPHYYVVYELGMCLGEVLFVIGTRLVESQSLIYCTTGSLVFREHNNFKAYLRLPNALIVDFLTV